MRWLQSLTCIMLLCVFVGFPRTVQAVEPDEILSDPVLEARARTLSAGLRCLVCRNQSIDDSNAPLARDLRVLLRERIVAGDTDHQAISYLVDRYGIYILLKPPVQPGTYLLWLGPLLMLAAAIAGFALLWKRRATDDEPDPGLNEKEMALLAPILNSEEPQ